MAKRSSIEKNKNRIELVKKYQARRLLLKSIVMNKSLAIEERFRAQLRLAELPRNSSKVRIRNRCEITGRPRAYYRRFKMSRIALRTYASYGLIPGVKKASW